VESFRQGLPLRDSPRPSQWSAWLPGLPLLPQGPQQAQKSKLREEEKVGRFDYRTEQLISPLSIIATAKCEMVGRLPIYSHLHPAPRTLGQWERMTTAPSLGKGCRQYALYPNRIFNDYSRAQVRFETALLEDLSFAIRNRELLRVQDVRTLRSKIYEYAPLKGYTKCDSQKVSVKDYRGTGILGHLVRLFLRGKDRNLSIRDKLLVGMDGLATPKAVAKFTRSHFQWR
jgi:hypothetical protein